MCMRLSMARYSLAGAPRQARAQPPLEFLTCRYRLLCSLASKNMARVTLARFDLSLWGGRRTWCARCETTRAWDDDDPERLEPKALPLCRDQSPTLRGPK